MPSLKGTETERNPKDALAAESEANCRYRCFAQNAEFEGCNDVVAVFRSAAEGKIGRVYGHLEGLEEVGRPAGGKPIGPTGDSLKGAIAGETHGSTDRYPGVAIARQEGFDEIADWLTLARTGTSHAGRFRRVLAAR